MAKKERIYQSFRWDESIHSITLGKQTNDFVSSVQEVVSGCNRAIDEFNANPANLKGKMKLDYVEYDEVYDYMNNDQNINVSIYSFGIIDVTNETPDYQDKIVLVKNCNVYDNYIKAIQTPFESEKIFRSFMIRICNILGGCYRLVDLNEFDLNYQKLKEEYPYVIHTKINFN